MATVYPELSDRLIKFIRRQPVFFVATAPCLDACGNGGHVNVSPKGYKDTFAVLDRLTVAYLDLSGSGAETIAHLRQNGRITIMFCSFAREPKILRIYGSGRVVLPGDGEWEHLAGHFGDQARAGAKVNGAGSAVDGAGETRGAGAPENANNTAEVDGAGSPGETDGAAEPDGVRDAAGPGKGPTVLRHSQRAIIVVDVDRIADSCGYAVPIMSLTTERDLLLRDAERRSPQQWVAYRAERNSASIDGLPALG
jgi:hypothetical protein